MRKLILLLLILCLNTDVNYVHAASTICRNYEGQKICLIDIQRSAKYYWEYRVILSINDQVQPRVIYDCLHQKKQKQNKQLTSFTLQDPGKLVCSIFFK